MRKKRKSDRAIYLRRHGPRVCHRDVLEIENGDATHDLLPGFENAEFEDPNCGFEELLDWIFTRIPIAETVDHYASAALGSMRWYRDHVVITYVPHLGRVHLLMDPRMFLFEVVVIHYLSKNFL